METLQNYHIELVKEEKEGLMLIKLFNKNNNLVDANAVPLNKKSNGLNLLKKAISMVVEQATEDDGLLLTNILKDGLKVTMFNDGEPVY